ncbi:hypothetical protein L1887_59817 [Cichorium endivia]|nr:hypothetical protein L1887_59817 [Cichorium endivia]
MMLGSVNTTAVQDRLVPLLGNVRSQEQDRDLERALGKSEQVGLQHGEAEVGLDDDVTVASQAARGNGVEEVDGKERPGLRVLERLPDVLHLELAVLHTGLVLSHTLHDLDAVVLRDAARLHRRGGQDIDDGLLPTQSSKDQGRGT